MSDVEVTVAHEFAAYLCGRDHALAAEADVDLQCDDLAGLDRRTWFARQLDRIYLQGVYDAQLAEEEEATDDDT